MTSEPAAAWYFDGRAADRRPAAVSRHAAGLEVNIEARGAAIWPDGTWRAAVDASMNRVRIERLPYTGECLIVEDENFARAFYAGQPLNSAVFGRKRLALVIMSAAAFAAAAGMWFGYQKLTVRLAHAIPRAAEERLGRAFVAGLAASPIEDERVNGGVRRIMARLEAGRPSPYTWRVTVTRNAESNAWAGPGGYLGIHSGMICAMDSPDQVAAVLAHEMTHGIERHATRNLIRILGFRLGISLVLGGGDEWADSVAMLGALRYMRSDEEAADSGALAVLNSAGIDPNSLAEAFERLEKRSSGLPGVLVYLSTHPPLSQRIAAAKRVRRLESYRSSVLPPAQWMDLRSGCDCQAR